MILRTEEIDTGNSDNGSVDTLTEEVATDTIETRGHDASYMLPPRSTRGVPPRRYNPEYEAQRSRYPIEKSSGSGNLSQSALAFKATLDTTKSPVTVEEALISAHWRKAMEEEINALNKNGTWE